MLASAAAFRTLKKAAEFGLSTDGIGFDFSKIIDRKDWIVSQITGPRMREYFKAQAIDIIDGTASFKSANEIDVDGRIISFDKAVIATGSTPFVPPIEGLDEVGYITSNEAINLRGLPESIIIVGGSAVGLEFGTVYESFGSQVTIVELAPRIASKEDADISHALHNYMNSRGVTIYTDARIKRAFLDNGVKALSFENPEGEIIVGAREILIATGRRPLTDNLNLENIGVETGKKGIKVNKHLQTSIENIYAAGDVIPGFQLAQAAAYEGDLVALNALSANKVEVSFRVIPRVTWSYPEIASVGITEDEAREKGINYRIEKFTFSGLGRAFTDGERLGFVKAIADFDTGEIIGFHVIGHHADEMIHEGVIAMQSRIKISELAQAIHCELTMSEGVGNAFIDLDELIHQERRMAA
ncbi:MAG: NAD(P)/FAD-dependent oxidoreductase [Actinobacteria bacterium]|nr:NAD(P)/FAD-dependent oxidoreductase [Actinomycetota bacterium]